SGTACLLARKTNIFSTFLHYTPPPPPPPVLSTPLTRVLERL
ncbi:hypothetical protein J2Z29_002825, partial [Treponema pedis]